MNIQKVLEFIDKFRNIFDREIFRLGETPITIITIIQLILIIAVFFVVSKLLCRFLRRRILSRLGLDDGVQYTILRLSHYLMMVFGILTALNLLGIPLTGLAVVFGLVGVGIAFGLQNITSNFVSGIILLFERPINVGDYIDVGETSGRVISINMRSTTVVTLDNITLIVPNSQFIENTITNWSVEDPKIRAIISIGVAYGSDTELVTDILLKIAESHPKILSDPKSSVLFKEFGDSSLNFDLRVWILNAIERFDIISDLNYAIDAAFRENNINIPFPQRDVHFFRE